MIRTTRKVLSRFRTIETLDTVSKERKPQVLLCSRRVTYINTTKKTRVEVLPLVHCNVSKLYVKRILSGLGTARDFSTVYIGSPYISTTAEATPQSQRGYSFSAAVNTSLTTDFPRNILVPDPMTASTYSNLFSQNERIAFFRGSLGSLPALCTQLNGTAHDEDTICILAPPRLMDFIDSQLTLDNGWDIESDTRMEVVENLNHNYGLFLNVLCVLGRVLAVVGFFYAIPIVKRFYDYNVAGNKADSGPREIPVDKIKYYTGQRTLEQETFLHKFRERMLTSPPGAGVDNRVHNHFWDRAFTWENIAYPKPLMAFREDSKKEAKGSPPDA
eukprot:TRINITY_DN2340_c0_g1_i1.p1 TRINITY_DN2340_c0_g1~~TRINITY_DN2340_c0_g1_i1.p1  ORF type:complete len:330 (+),score=26.77 TRINITY_DN2340_c0_g1_i1:59-1048(+)